GLVGSKGRRRLPAAASGLHGVQLGRVEARRVTHAHGVDGDGIRAVSRAELSDSLRRPHLATDAGLTAEIRRALSIRGAGACIVRAGSAGALAARGATLGVGRYALVALTEVTGCALSGRGARAAIAVTVVAAAVSVRSARLRGIYVAKVAAAVVA